VKYCSACKEKFDDSLSFCPDDGEVLEEDPTSLLGTVLDGQYQIEGILGKGGMGAVYRARHILLGDRVAIKVLPPEMRSNTEWLRRFQREGQAARRFRHPNAVTVYDLRTSSDGMIYLVMEYVEGSTLDAELKKHGRFSPAEALVVLEPVMSVLNAAHAMGVVHRDLKPENVMIGRPTTGGEPVVKLLDLGIAKLREVAGAEQVGTTALTIAGQMLGTPYYMSPEQWGELPRDGNSDIDGRADIYSLGVVFYELIAGQRPFSGMTLSEMRREHVSVTPRPLHEFVPNVPESYSRAITKAIAKDRSDRQATAGELEHELMTALAAEGIKPSTLLTSSFSSGAVSTSSAGGSATAAERTKPTVVADSAFTEVEKGVQPAVSPRSMSSQTATMPTVIASEREIAGPGRAGAVASTATMASLAHGVISPSIAPAVPRRSPLLFVGAGIVALLLVIGAGGYAVIHFVGSARTDPTPTGSANGTTGTDLSAGAHEIGRYWLEVKTENESDSVRADELVSMQSGQEFKFHFSPSESGYLYIIGPGSNNTTTTFLTAKPSAGSGLKTNEVKSGIDFAFPADSIGRERWITLDKTPGTDEFTIIFSTAPLSQPGFLAGPAEYYLSSQEEKQLEDMRNVKANAVGTEVIKTGVSPSVSVKVPQTSEGAPVIFRVRIEHK
jgi:eukaryotic-like serine/threonine-protein kinase